jgi:hypothetical protein
MALYNKCTYSFNIMMMTEFNVKKKISASVLWEYNGEGRGEGGKIKIENFF